MAASYRAKNSSRQRSTVYESCKKIVDARNRFQKLQSQLNSSDFELRKFKQESSKSQNENSNEFQICKQYVEIQQEKFEGSKVEHLSDVKEMLNESELYTENINSFLEKLYTMNQVLLENKTDSEYDKGSTEINSYMKRDKFKMKLIVCSECDTHFEKRTELALHFKQNHGKKRGRPSVPVECNVCQKKFTCKKDYAIHFRIHSEKTYECPSCKKMCFLTVPHSCKNVKYEKTKCSVWDACKKVLTEKSFQQVPSENSKFFVQKLPISKKAAYMNTTPNEVILKNLKSPSDKIKITSTLNVNKSIMNSICSDQDSVEQLFSECKNLDNLKSDNLVNFQTEAINVAEIDNAKFYCNKIDISFKEIEKYDAHYSTNLLDEFCQMREGDEELNVCNVCGGCFTELTAFHAHKFTHIN